MTVRMLVTTQTPKNGFARAGDVLDVDQETCDRWQKFHIAEVVSSDVAEVSKASMEEIANADVSDKTISSLSEQKKSAKPERKKARR